MRIIKLFGFILILCLPLWCAGQNKSYMSGYVMKHNGDTVLGFVKDRSPEPFVSLHNKIRFKKPGSLFKKKYSPKDIRGYGYGDSHFASVRFREERTLTRSRYFTDSAAPLIFLEVRERTPELVHYEMWYVDEDNSYLESVPFFHRPGSNQIVRVTQGIFGFKRKRLSEYFEDCPNVLALLKSDTKPAKSVPEFYDQVVKNCR